MKLFAAALGALVALVSLGSCAVPSLSEPNGLHLKLLVTQPSWQGSSRLLLPTAERVSVSAVPDQGTTIRASGPLVGNEVTLTLPLVAFKTYALTARATGSDGKVLFSGEAKVTLTAGQSLSLALLPVAPGGGAWPVVQPQDQSAGGSISQSFTFPSGTSSTWILNFGSDATDFTFAAPPSGLSLYVQDPSGAAVGLSADRVVAKPASGLLWATYYAPTARTLTTLGRFGIPTQSFALKGPAALAPGDTGTLSLTSLLPANATTDRAQDYTWSAVPSNLVTLGTAGATMPITAGSLGGTVTITAQLKANSAVQASFPVLITDSIPVTFTVAPFETLAFSPSSLAFVQDQTLVVLAGTAALRSSGSDWEWLIDGQAAKLGSDPSTLTFQFGDPLQSQDLRDLTLGLHTLNVSVTFGGVRYSGSVPLTVNPLENL